MTQENRWKLGSKLRAVTGSRKGVLEIPTDQKFNELIELISFVIQMEGWSTSKTQITDIILVKKYIPSR